MIKLGWLTLPGDHRGNLDDRVDVGLGEDAFAARAFDVEAEDAQRGNGKPVSLRGMRHQVLVAECQSSPSHKAY